MSLWADGREAYLPYPSFTQPAPAPEIDPGSGPFICVHFNPEWLPVVLGSLLQLTQPSSWDEADPDTLNTILGRATALMNIFSTAEACPVLDGGSVSGTVASRTPYQDFDVTFASTFTAAPVVVATGLTDKLDVTVSSITETGCTFRLSFATEVISDTSVSADWFAYQAP
jgi:hypothetical protein